MGWAHDWTQRIDAFGWWYISLSVCFPGTPSPHALSRLRVSSIRRHQTTVMTQPTPSSPAMGPRLKTQDNNSNNNNKRGGGTWETIPLPKILSVQGWMWRASAEEREGGPHTDGWMTCCCLKRPPRQEKISQCGSSFCLSNGLITKRATPALHARIPLPSLPHTPACAYVACARALISPASRRGSRLARRSS